MNVHGLSVCLSDRRIIACLRQLWTVVKGYILYSKSVWTSEWKFPSWEHDFTTFSPPPYTSNYEPYQTSQPTPQNFTISSRTVCGSIPYVVQQRCMTYVPEIVLFVCSTAKHRRPKLFRRTCWNHKCSIIATCMYSIYRSFFSVKSQY